MTIPTARLFAFLPPPDHTEPSRMYRMLRFRTGDSGIKNSNDGLSNGLDEETNDGVDDGTTDGIGEGSNDRLGDGTNDGLGVNNVTDELGRGTSNVLFCVLGSLSSTLKWLCNEGQLRVGHCSELGEGFHRQTPTAATPSQAGHVTQK